MILTEFIDALKPYADEAKALGFWQELADAYEGPGRYYHNLQHLESMLIALLAVKEAIERWDEAMLALCYHDAVYEPMEKDNEARSAQLAAQCLRKLSFPEEKTTRITELILATRDHVLRDNQDTNLFTDADLSILGKPKAMYDVYAASVRKEYSMVPDLLYRPGRKKVLDHFLAMDFIFKTPFFREKYELVARENLSRERSKY